MPPLTDEQVAAAATFLQNARAQRAPFPAIPEDCRPDTVADATRIAEALRGDASAAGWKAGASSVAQMRDLGTDTPPTGPLRADVLMDSPAELDAAGYNICIMEAEVAFRLAGDLPARDAPYSLDEIKDAIGSAHIAIEAPNNPYAPEANAGMLGVIAAGFGAASLVVGPEIADWRDRDLQTLDVELIMDGEVVATGLEGDARCDPLGVLQAMANDFSSRGFGMQAGQVITTGAAAPPTPAKPGQTTIARFPGIGEVVATLG